MKTLPLTLLTVCLAIIARAADPAPLSEVRVKETAGHNYFCIKKELKLPQMAEFAPEAITQLMEKATELKAMHGGPIMFTYYNFHGDPDQVFTAEIGLQIAKADAPKGDGLYVRKTEKFKCAAAIFQGSLSKIGEAWQTFAAAAMAKGEPTGESRELYLYWEGHDSPNNIIELQMGLK